MTGGKIQNLLRIAGLITGLVLLQQLIAQTIFGMVFDWVNVPQLVLVNFGIVVAWYYFIDTNKKIPPFAVTIAAFCLTIWLRAVLFYLSVFRFIAPPVISFIEKQLVVIISFITTPQAIPAMFAALVLLVLLPKAKELYGRGISNGSF